MPYSREDEGLHLPPIPKALNCTCPDMKDLLPHKDVNSSGLTSDEARIRLAKDGPDAMPETSAHPIRNALTRFWAPVPW